MKRTMNQVNVSSRDDKTYVLEKLIDHIELLYNNTIVVTWGEAGPVSVSVILVGRQETCERQAK